MNPTLFIRIILFLLGLFLITPAYASQPKEIKQTNITGAAFTISWITDTPGTGAISYGIGTNSLNLLATDNRSGNIHHIEVVGLSSNDTYYYNIISGGVIDGQQYSCRTGPFLEPPTGTDMVYGQVLKADGITVAQGSLVYLTICNTDSKGSPGTSSEWSTVVESNGYWSLPLSNVRTSDLSSFFEYSPSGDQLSILVQGGIIEGTCKLITDTANDSPCQNIRVSTDTTAPGTITTLEVKTVEPNSAVLKWTAPGDDGNIGTATGYQVRYSTTPITETNWSQASNASGTPTPKLAGTSQQMTVRNLSSGIGYYFAIKAYDEVPNWSGMSNVVATTTIVQSMPILQWTGQPNFVTDGLRSEIGTTGMNIVYQVAYIDNKDSQPTLGYPKVRIYREDEGLVGTYTMLYASGNYSTGARYTFSRQFEPGTYTYQFDGGNVLGNAQLCMKKGPIILESLPDHAATGLGTITAGTNFIYGQVHKQGGIQAASDAVVYVRVQDGNGTGSPGVSAIGSSTVDANGIWSIELANFTGTHSFVYSPSGDYLHIWINGAVDGVASQILMMDENMSPVCDLELCNDHIPPATVTSLAVQTSTTNSITLNWTVSGDDGNIGTASYYHIKYGIFSDRDRIANWGISVIPLVAGNRNSCSISGLSPAATYSFIIQASDDVWNTSAPSLSVMGTTAPLPQHPPILSTATTPLTPGIANVYTKFTYNVKYADIDGDLPPQGEPKVVIYQGGNEVKTCSMTCVAGGATYTCSTLLPFTGTYSYRFEVTGATSSPTGNGPMVFDIPDHFRITNVTDRQFTVSWRTGTKGTGSVSYGTTTSLGSVTEDCLARDVHFVTVGNLEPDTVYYFDVTGDNNNGKHYLIKTGASISNISPGSNFITGFVYERKGIPAEGAVVYVTIKDADGKDSPEECAPLSVLTDANGGWFVDTRYARTRDYLSKFEYSDNDTIYIEVDGGERGKGNELLDAKDATAGHTPDIILWTWLGASDKLLVKDMTYSYPNPAKSVNTITFRYYLNADADVTLSIYNLAGELVQTIKGIGIGYKDTNELMWDITDVASDIYIWRLEVMNGELRDVMVKRLVVIK